ncbi:MAG: SDR family oxidoreductase [Myxococcota bacterium]|nr:SDR family oxidoreductase [Myxococcota bacterium]
MTNQQARDKVAVVTGGAIRVGEAISRRLAAAGYHVVIHAFSHENRARSLAIELGGSHICADLSQRAGAGVIFNHVDALGLPLEILVNNAAIFQPSAPEAVTEEMWDTHIAVNITAPFQLAQLAAPRMRRQGNGAIINLLDIASLRPESDYVHYSATKAALESLTKGLAAQWAPEIRVNGVAPGAALMPETFTDAERQLRLDRTPMGIEPGAAPIAEAVEFLAIGPKAITGVVLPVDGGLGITW